MNRMPTLVVQNQSHFECLFNRTSDYDFLRIFGCLCFLFLHPYHAHKLDFRSSPCVFLGYSSSHLGYRCLDFTSQRIYVSRHVHFYEGVFPFTESEQIAHPPTSFPVHTLAHLDYPPSNFIPAELPNTTPAYLLPLQPHPHSRTIPHLCLPLYHRHPALPICHHLHVFIMIIMQEQVHLL